VFAHYTELHFHSTCFTVELQFLVRDPSFDGDVTSVVQYVTPMGGEGVSCRLREAVDREKPKQAPDGVLIDIPLVIPGSPTRSHRRQWRDDRQGQRVQTQRIDRRTEMVDLDEQPDIKLWIGSVDDSNENLSCQYVQPIMAENAIIRRLLCIHWHLAPISTMYRRPHQRYFPSAYLILSSLLPVGRLDNLCGFPDRRLDRQLRERSFVAGLGNLSHG
jgi:hypothetical protein